nr:ATP-dependent sacrificial sulfur transferase LarE [Planctomycetota bacterium]
MTSGAPPELFPSVRHAEARALEVLTGFGEGAVLALSGGTDSALLLSLAAEAIRTERLVAVTSRSESLPVEELQAAVAQARAAGVAHVVLEGSELDVEAFRRNAPDRCFHCKNTMYADLRRIADERGVPYVLDGTNADDTGDHRPGLGAARVHDVASPLLLAGLTKQWVRAVSAHRGLDTWDKPAEACLSSRFPYGTPVTREGLDRVYRAERVLKDLGFRTVRVRVHDPIARIEVPVEDIPALLQADLKAH